MIQILGLLLLCTGAANAADRLCIVIDGWLKQVDAGNGHVYGVNNYDDVYHLVNGIWQQLPGKLIHVTAGLAGVWGVNRLQNVYKLVYGTWLLMSGRLKQIDAGGNKFVVGVNGMDDIYCLNQNDTTSNSSNQTYVSVDGSLMYYSCGNQSCWGVNAYNYIYYRYNAQPTNCKGTSWQQIDGQLKMVEVGSDGSVEGISAGNPIGTSWTQLNFVDSFQHVSYDQGNLWMITVNGAIYKCKVNGVTNPDCY
ncbi:fish-egg lectin-like [Anomaloglossus baeobatrachus]